jgi:hypothetical protein
MHAGRRSVARLFAAAVMAVVVVAPGLSFGVHIGGWDELGKPIGGVDPDLPTAVVDQPVMMSTEENRVVQRGMTAVGPMLDMVPVAPSWWSVTSRMGAAPVAENQRPPQRTGEQAPLPADVENLPRAAEDGR